MTDAPRITDDEVQKFRDDCLDAAFNSANLTPEQCALGIRTALAAFLRARVPEPMPDDGDAAFTGFNACRDAVLKGRE